MTLEKNFYNLIFKFQTPNVSVGAIENSISKVLQKDDNNKV